MPISSIRALLAILTLASVVAATGLAFFLGPTLTDVQLTLLTMLLTSLIGKLAMAFTFYFDGLPAKTALPEQSNPVHSPEGQP